MHPVYRLLITLLLAISLPLHGMAGTWQGCCEPAHPVATRAAVHATGVSYTAPSHGSHGHAHTDIPMQADTADAATDHGTAATHACTHTANCCSLALMTHPLVPALPAIPQASWLSFQPPTPHSHTPATADPPPRSIHS